MLTFIAVERNTGGVSYAKSFAGHFFALAIAFIVAQLCLLRTNSHPNRRDSAFGQNPDFRELDGAAPGHWAALLVYGSMIEPPMTAGRSTIQSFQVSSALTLIPRETNDPVNHGVFRPGCREFTFTFPLKIFQAREIIISFEYDSLAA